MKWTGRRFICSSSTLDIAWYKKNTMVPVPLLVQSDRLRLFVTMCDEQNVGRIGYIDVNPEEPSEIIDYSREPVLDIGRPGYFDDSGVLPSAIFSHKNEYFMLYSAYQKHARVPYSILTGLAKFSGGNFKSLERTSTVPLLERTEKEQFIRSAAFLIDKGGEFTMFYSSGSEWTNNATKEVPRYDIKCIRSSDLFDWRDATPETCVTLRGDEYGLTTPSVFHGNGKYQMFYSIRSISSGYRLGYAESEDCRTWSRMDENMEIDVAVEGWDSEMLCFGNIFVHGATTYLFYCGNHYGMGGVGYATLSD